jgi:hypothetical protein
MTAMLEAPAREAQLEMPPAEVLESAEVLEDPAPGAELLPVPTKPRRRIRAGRHRPVLPTWAIRAAGLYTLVALVVGVAIEPDANGAQPQLPAWATALGAATIYAFFAAWISLGVGRRYGLWISAGAGASLVVQSALCPALDHHVIAGWWWAQLGLAIGIVVLSLGLLAGTRAAGRHG